jgi:MOSC domain-containing protein YiiM
MSTERYFTQAELEAGLPEVRRAPGDGGTLVQIVVRPDKKLRELAQSCTVTPEAGIPADHWARHCTHQLPDGRLNPETQITLMNSRCLALVAGSRDRWPLAGDNLLVDLDLSEANLATGQRLKIGEAILEITAKPHTGCSKFSKRFGADALKFVNSPEGKALRLRGVHAQVVQPGRITVGDRIEKL